MKVKKVGKIKKVNVIIGIYNKLHKTKSRKLRLKLNSLTKLQRFKLILKNLKKNQPLLLKKISVKNFISYFKSKNKKVYKSLKQNYKSTNNFLSKRFKKLLLTFPKADLFGKTKRFLKKKISKMSRVKNRRKMRKNLGKRTFFFRIIRKARRRKIKAFRLNNNKAIFTKKTKKEKKFLLRARESLLKTKKYLYRKQFPKIKGKKNRNFNFFYYNNIDRAPFRFHIGRIVITYLLNNTFINIHNSKKMLKVLSAGKLGFRGPKRSTPYSRQVVARKAIKFVSKTKLNILDIYLNSNYNRWYYFIFKEISKPRVKPYVIRYLVISNPRSHGFIRDRKHRRK